MYVSMKEMLLHAHRNGYAVMGHQLYQYGTGEGDCAGGKRGVLCSYY